MGEAFTIRSPCHYSSQVDGFSTRLLENGSFRTFWVRYLRARGSILQLELEVEKNPQRVGATIHDLESNATLATQAPAVFVYSKELQSEWAAG